MVNEKLCPSGCVRLYGAPNQPSPSMGKKPPRTVPFGGAAAVQVYRPSVL